MASFKISKRDDAPEGDAGVAVANTNFKVTDDTPYETDDLEVVETVKALYSDIFTVDTLDAPEIDGRKVMRDINKLHKEQEKVEKKRGQIADKDPTADKPEVPTSVEDLSETKGNK